MNDKIIDILSTIPKEVLIHCVMIIQNKKFKEPSICKIGINSPAGKPETVIFSTGEFMPMSSNTLIK